MASMSQYDTYYEPVTLDVPTHVLQSFTHEETPNSTHHPVKPDGNGNLHVVSIASAGGTYSPENYSPTSPARASLKEIHCALNTLSERPDQITDPKLKQKFFFWQMTRRMDTRPYAFSLSGPPAAVTARHDASAQELWNKLSVQKGLQEKLLWNAGLSHRLRHFGELKKQHVVVLKGEQVQGVANYLVPDAPQPVGKKLVTDLKRDHANALDAPQPPIASRPVNGDDSTIAVAAHVAFAVPFFI
jgi:hypothetical protein